MLHNVLDRPGELLSPLQNLIKRTSIIDVSGNKAALHFVSHEDGVDDRPDQVLLCIPVHSCNVHITAVAQHRSIRLLSRDGDPFGLEPVVVEDVDEKLHLHPGDRCPYHADKDVVDILFGHIEEVRE